MPHDRRSYLRTSSAVIASLLAASTPTSAADTPPEWDPDTVYTDGDKATFDGYVWEAKWWTKGDKPGADEWGPWTQRRPVDDSPTDPGGPTASFTTSESVIEPGTAVTVDAGDTTGSVDSYEWAFGDGTTAAGVTASHTYDAAGEYTIELTVTTGDGTTDTATQQITATTSPGDDEFKVVGYYPSWKGTDDYDFYPADVPFDQVTDVLYAFLDVQPDGTVVLPDSDVDHESLLASFASLKQDRAADTRLKLSIGGWGLSPGFEDAAADQASRERFATTAVDLMRTYDFDGIDVDWEHPGPRRGKCECGSAQGPANHVALLETVRDRLNDAEVEDGRTYDLSVANGGSDWNAALINHREVAAVVDDIYMMAYDFTGVWHGTAGLNAPIYGTPPDYPPSGDAQQYTLETTLTIWKEQGYWVDWMEWEDHGDPVDDPGTLVLGMPFYGRGCNVENGIWDTFSLSEWQQGDPKYQNDVIPPGTWNDLRGPDDANTGAFDYGDLAANYEGADAWTKQRNEQGGVPYLWNDSEGVFISYDDPTSIAAKVELAVAEDLGGVMIWELSQDYDGTLLETINQHTP
ncbi:PKD domain-containing protein [Halobacterium salinarum]|uniref:glycosyl hydrolase family 18 protein n=2 Tax=Halobacterium salinarum TaxID=2242 RepID=UPI001F1A0A34|nr:glycosyl hydrolase family 18 protein [Halobacterium salinarum]MCF2237782.1 PKD domain-containing protein [Halobacterium salinarum]